MFVFHNLTIVVILMIFYAMNVCMSNEQLFSVCLRLVDFGVNSLSYLAILVNLLMCGT